MLCNTPLIPCSQCKYLGVIMQKWNHHMEVKVTKANQMLTMIQINVHFASKITRELAYNTFVQPHLEYASVVWSPWQSYLEGALKSSAQYGCNKYGIISAINLINDLKWETLKVQRIKSSLCSYNVQNSLWTCQYPTE